MSDRTTTLNHESANRTATASAEPAATPATTDDKERQKLVRKLVALLIILAAVVLTLYVWSVLERHPRTDDAAAPGVQSATAQQKQSEDTLHRLEPLLPKHFATAEQVDEARTKVAVAAQEVAADEQKLNQARAQLSQLQTLLAQRPGAAAAV